MSGIAYKSLNTNRLAKAMTEYFKASDSSASAYKKHLALLVCISNYTGNVLYINPLIIL